MLTGNRLLLSYANPKKRAAKKTVQLVLQNELNNDVKRFTIKPVLQQIRLLTGLMMWVVKRTTSLFNAFCNNVARQVARF